MFAALSCVFTASTSGSWSLAPSTTATQLFEKHPACTAPAGLNWCGGDRRAGVTGLTFVDKHTLALARLNGTLERYNYTTGQLIDAHHFQLNVDELAAETGMTGLSAYNGDVFFSLTTFHANESNYGVAVKKMSSTGHVTTLYHKIDKAFGANAHNMHGPYVAAVGEGHPVLLVPFGDLNSPSTASDPTKDAGKVLIMNLDGSELRRDVFDTGHPNNMHLAYGNRNMFQVTCLSRDLDRLGRCLWSENGNYLQRLVFASLLHGGGIDLQWKGDDNRQWLNMHDPLTKSAAVLHTRVDTSCVFLAVMPRLTVRGELVFVESCTGSEGKGRTVSLKKIVNMHAAQPAVVFVQNILTSNTTTASSPMAMALVPGDKGQLVVGDVFTGNVYEISNPILTYSNYKNSLHTDISQVSSFCESRPSWNFVYVMCSTIAIIQYLVVAKGTNSARSVHLGKLFVALMLCVVGVVALWRNIPNRFDFV